MTKTPIEPPSGSGAEAGDLLEQVTASRLAYSQVSRLLAHELVHALTQKGHPTRQKVGNILADQTADIGSNITKDQCACMLQSPWVRKIPLD